MNAPLRPFHRLGDFAIGIVLVLWPVFGYSGHYTAVAVTLGFGIVMLLNAALLEHDFAGYPKISLPTHLGIEAVCGGAMIAAPWVFGFADTTWIPLVVLGIVTASRSVLFYAGHRVKLLLAGTRKRRRSSPAA